MLPQRFDFDSTHSHLEKIYYFLASAGLGEIISAPLERAKIQIQTKPQIYTKSFLGYREVDLTVREIAKSEGFLRLFYGLKGSLDKQMFFNCFRFYGYYYSLDYLFKNPDHEFRQIPALVSCILGTSLGTIATQTSDVVRIRMQTESLGADNDKLVGSRKKVSKLVEGNKGKSGILFSGLKANLLLQNVHAVSELFLFFKLKTWFDKWKIFRSNYTTNTVSIVLTNTLTTLLVAPLDAIHTQSVVRGIQGEASGIAASFKAVLKQDGGAKTFYRGYLPFFYKTVAMNLTIATFLQYYYDKFIREIMYEELIQNERDYYRQLQNEKYEVKGK